MTRAGRLWVAIDLDFVDPAGNRHGIGDAAVLAYIRLLAWAKRHRTDGLVPFSVVPSLLKGTAAELESAGLIATDDDDQLVICDWHKWHASGDELARRRAADAERKRLARRGYALSSKDLKDRDRDIGRTSDGHRTDIGRGLWTEDCPHGAPHGGRSCIECRTDQNIF